MKDARHVTPALPASNTDVAKQNRNAERQARRKIVRLGHMTIVWLGLEDSATSTDRALRPTSCPVPNSRRLHSLALPSASEKIAVLSVSGQWLANDERFLKRFASFSKPIGNWLKSGQAVLAREYCFHTWASFQAMVTNPEVAVIDLRLINHAEIVAAIREILRE